MIRSPGMDRFNRHRRNRQASRNRMRVSISRHTPEQDSHAQYQALRPMLGDRNAMLATLYPEVRQPLIAQALEGRQEPGQTSEHAPATGVIQQAQTQT